ncbi:adenosylcobinamide-GDP ribazoletransferase [Thiocystis minor]|uniref:adenosylcobinamide-GDP ribazoletransferase n=1 Tax=Thiocystis minor TaxID=61597 RepID=UPI0019147F9D|nr:adenosylcobinamide-GDP ribazoletransferase [Thiocystis minor]MBK5963194.1 adenosylcobinamide-GDP ribazoletransferase [Thiocystis minor]
MTDRFLDLLRLRPLWIAGRFLTRLPFPDPGCVTPAEAGWAVPWYPFVGLLLGGLIALVAWTLGSTDPSVAAALTLLLWVWSTGGLHLDGLADSADAWVGGLASRERTLEIMKDPRSGPAAVTAIALVLIAKWAGLAALIAHGESWLLLWIPLLARTQLPLLLLTTPYARKRGMASDQVNQLPRRAAWMAGVLVLAGCPLSLGWIGGLTGVLMGLALVLGSLLILLLARRSMLARIAGFTGDTAGALVEITETLLLLATALLAIPF